MKIKLFILLIILRSFAIGQNLPTVIYNATIHVGNGTVIENGMIIMRDGKIEYIGQKKETPFDIHAVSSIDASGKQVYPGLIAMNSKIGLEEIEQARATADVNEVGNYNPNIRSVIAYNTDSKVIPTLRTNGVLIAEVVPEAGIIQGKSSVVKMSGWNWEDAALVMDNNMHMHWPGAYSYNNDLHVIAANPDYTKQVNDIISFFNDAKAYCAETEHTTKNLRFEAMRDLFDRKQKLFITSDQAKEIIGAVELSKKFNIQIVIVGGRESYRVIDLLKENNIPVLIEAVHELPAKDGDAVDLPYRLPGILTNAGILCGLTMSNTGSSYWNVRNLGFESGTTAAYGLTKEQALELITINNAKLLGIDSTYGTLETGKSATLFISDGDALDMKSSAVEYIFINGERIGVENWQTELYKKFMIKYGK